MLKKTILLITLLFFIFSNHVFSSDKKAIVILDFQNTNDYNAFDFLSEYFSRIFKDILNTKFKIISRDNYSSVIKEITDVSPHFLFEKKIAFQIGRILNAHAVIMGRFNCHFPGDSTGDSPSKLSVEVMVVLVNHDKVEILQESVNSRRDEILRNATTVSQTLCNKVIKFLEKN